MYQKIQKFVVYAAAAYFVFQIVVFVLFSINYLWSNRISHKKENLEEEYTRNIITDQRQIQQFKSTKGYQLFKQTEEADSLRYYLDKAINEMNDSTSNITQKQ